MAERPPVCDYEGSEYQQTFWDTGQRAYEDLSEARALKALLPPAGRLLLELGAGAGRNTSRYAGFERIVLLDYSSTQLQQAQARLGDWPPLHLRGRQRYALPFVPGLFDAATMIRVIHHLADAPAALRQVRTGAPARRRLHLRIRQQAKCKSHPALAAAPADAGARLTRRRWSLLRLNFDFHPRTMLDWLRAAGLPPRHGAGRLLLPAGRPQTARAAHRSRQPGRHASAHRPAAHAVPQRLCPRAGHRRASPQPRRAFFRCPVCGGAALADHGDHLLCAQCGRRWRFQDGIYNFKEPA